MAGGCWVLRRAGSVAGCCRSIIALPVPQLIRHTSNQPPGVPSPSLTSSEALRVLRPFYLAVHPDLFSKFPEEKAANEDSLKLLNSYLDALGSYKRPQPVHLRFYIHPSVVKEGGATGLRPVGVSLNAYSVGSAIFDLLWSCDLFAHISVSMKAKLAEIKSSDVQVRPWARYIPQSPAVVHPFKDWDNLDDLFTRHSKKKVTPVHLDTWLQENLPTAQECLDRSQPTREGNVALVQDLCSRFTLQGIVDSHGLTAATLRGHLQSLRKLLEQERAVVEELGPELMFVFDYSSGMELNGYIHLNCEETIQQWAKFLSAARMQVESIRKLEPLETELSHLLGEVTIERPTYVSLEVYRRWLEEYCEVCRRRPNAVPVVSGATLILTGCAENLPSLTESGSILVPVSCPMHSLVDFINTSHHKAKQLKSEHERQQKVTKESLEQCRSTLGLSELTRSQGMTDSQVHQGCRELLKLGSTISNSHRSMLKGHHFCLSAYYSVTLDGYIRIPWNCALSHTI